MIADEQRIALGWRTVAEVHELAEAGTVDRPDTAIRIGHRTRVVGGAAISGPAVLGDGSQVIGQVAVQAIDLAAGGDWTSADPDGRGGVLKGFGRGATSPSAAARSSTGRAISPTHPSNVSALTTLTPHTSPAMVRRDR